VSSTVRTNAVPVSSAQREIWFAQQRNPESPVYRVGEYIEIHGPVDEVRFEAAIRQAVTETDALQRRFFEENGELWQYTHTNGTWSLPVLDLSDRPDPRAAAEEWMRADLARTMDPTCDDLFSYALFRIAADRYLWCQTYHHIVMDAFSWSLFAQRLAELYAAASAPAGLPHRRPRRNTAKAGAPVGRPAVRSRRPSADRWPSTRSWRRTAGCCRPATRN